MSLYAESNAVLAWLLAEPAADAVRDVLGAAGLVVASDLTLVECDRALIRAQSTGRVPQARGDELRSQLHTTAGGWSLLRLDGEVIERARRPFPGEPLRTLDALHLASALVARAAVPGLALLSLDGRIRAAASELGLRILPE